MASKYDNIVGLRLYQSASIVSKRLTSKVEMALVCFICVHKALETQQHLENRTIVKLLSIVYILAYAMDALSCRHGSAVIARQEIDGQSDKGGN